MRVLKTGEKTSNTHYQTDHLGSTGYLTDKDGALKQHIEYTPWGESWFDNPTTPLLDYKFTVKEQDSTGLYYFGARYYDPRTSVWVSTDPIIRNYLPSANNSNLSELSGAGGVFNLKNLSMYMYSYGSPIIMIDLDGNEPKYFVVHSTGMASSAETYKSWKGKVGKGHLYIMPNGERIQIVGFDKMARATKTENVRKDLRGKMYHIELVYKGGDKPTDEQYKELAAVFKELNDKEADGLIIVSHREIDRGIPEGHNDPTDFDFDVLYSLLEKLGLKIEEIKKISQERHKVNNMAGQVNSWPPELEGKPKWEKKIEKKPEETTK